MPTDLSIALSTDLYALGLVVAMLGARHGFDADHLAAIDAMTRFNAARRPRLARRIGLLFSLGHGAVVVGAALAAAALSTAWRTPAWLDTLGACVSIGLLSLLGLLNLAAVVRTPAGDVVRLAGWRSRGVARWLSAGDGWSVAGIGALFALSFDTVSLAALIAVSATRFGGPSAVLGLAGLFVLGLLVTDGINGVWIAGLLRRSAETAAIASRVMAGAVALASLATAALGAAALAVPALRGWLSGHAGWLGAGVVATVLVGFWIGRWLAARRPRGGGGSAAAPAGAGAAGSL